jgi:phage FluMu gp28-like protein
VQGTHLNPEQFLTNCRARAGTDEIFQQSYMCNPMGAASANIVEWSAIERCRSDYEIERVHLEAEEVLQQFGEFSPYGKDERESQIRKFLRNSFPSLLSDDPDSSIKNQTQNSKIPPVSDSTWLPLAKVTRLYLHR